MSQGCVEAAAVVVVPYSSLIRFAAVDADVPAASRLPGDAPNRIEVT
jgi:hypothetical protein